jgi:ABC-type cobalamin/Fe3+-siderophores transport system ATPase subunit
VLVAKNISTGFVNPIYAAPANVSKLVSRHFMIAQSPHQTGTVIGPDGAGKSTLMEPLARNRYAAHYRCG